VVISEGIAMAVVTVKNIENAAGGLLTNEVSAASTVTSGGSVPTVAAAMLAVAVAAVVMWLAYHFWIKPVPIHFTTGYVPYAGVVFMTAGLERFLEPVSQVLLPSDPAKRAAASSKSEAQAMGADPATDAAAVAVKAAKAADEQAKADRLREQRTIIFWAIASICGLGISGGFGFFLLQSVSVTPVNSFLDLAITGLTIGAGTKPLHDLITSMQAKASSAA
jgi:biotin transporter BioY